jgi:hypothetical protein
VAGVRAAWLLSSPCGDRRPDVESAAVPRRQKLCADAGDEVDERSNRTYRCLVSLRAFSVVALVGAFSLAASTLALSQLAQARLGAIPPTTEAWSHGTNGPDNLVGTAAADGICGLDGDDVITGGAGADYLLGDGILTPETGQRCPPTSGFSELGVGNDTLYSGPGRAMDPSHLYGGAGNDVLVGGPHSDFLYGGQGDDEIRAGGSSGPGGWVDILDGEAGDDELIGSPDADHLYGGTGRNVLKGRAGDDSLSVLKGAGKSTYDAGPGADTVYSVNRKRERIDCGRGRDRVEADKGDLLRNCEQRITPKRRNPPPTSIGRFYVL